MNFYSPYNLQPDYLFSKMNDEQEVLDFIQFAGFGNIEEDAKMPAAEQHLDPDFVNKYSVKQRYASFFNFGFEWDGWFNEQCVVKV